MRIANYAYGITNVSVSKSLPVAEGVGFEPTETASASTVFETVPFVRSGSLPLTRLANTSAEPKRLNG